MAVALFGKNVHLNRPVRPGKKHSSGVGLPRFAVNKYKKTLLGTSYIIF